MTPLAELGARPASTAAQLPLLLAVLLGGGCGSPPPDPRQNEVRNALQDFSSDSGPDRRRAATRLERLLPPAKQAQGIDAEAIGRLRVLVTDDRDDHVRAAAIRTLGRIGDERSWEVIGQRATASEAQVRIEVLQALVSIDAGRAFPVLVQAMGDAEPAVRLVAATTLAGSEAGVAELTLRLGCDGTDQTVLIYGLESSPLPSAAQTLLTGLTSSNPLLRVAAIRKAGIARHRPAVPILAGILTKARDRRAGLSDELFKAAAHSLATIGGDDAFLPLLILADGSLPWLDEVLLDHQAELRPLLVAQAANGTGRSVQVETLVKYLMRDPSAESVRALADLATSDLPDLVKVCPSFAGVSTTRPKTAQDSTELVKVCQIIGQRAPAELRSKVAARLRGVLDRKHPRASELVTALGLVGQPGDGPDAAAVCELLHAAHNEIKALKAAGLSSAPTEKGAEETPQQMEDRLRVAEREALVCSAAQACGRLRASAAAPIFAALLCSDHPAQLAAGVAGALALGDAANIERVNRALLTTTVHPYPLFRSGACGDMLRECHDPRILPGLVALMARGERKTIYGIIAANGTPEAAAILMAELASSDIPLETKRYNLAPLMAGFGAAGRPLFLKTMLETPPPAKRGDPDLGWWSAEFLREQRNAAAPDILAALAKNRPTGPVAARFIHALDLADTPEVVAAQTTWLTDADPNLASLALHSLVRNRRTGALACIRAARQAAGPGPWRDRLDQAIADLTAPVKGGSS